MNCPRCGSPLREGAWYCTGCGLSTAEIGVETGRAGARDTVEIGGRAATDSLVGRVLDSKYELLAPLGEGGMGTVYRARRLHIGDEVAVKVLHQKFLLDQKVIERFRREARSAASIAHPNVVTIHDYSEARPDGSPAYIVMELVKGTSLRGLLRREGRLAAGRAVALMRDVCAGVGVAHSRGIVHRDLKPDNVIIVPPVAGGEREAAKVVDFGIAKLRDLTTPLDLTQTGAVLGTPYYMSPEQCRGEHLDTRADVYSLGAMLYEMLAGVPPFRAGNLAALISQHLIEAPPPLPPGLQVRPALEGVCRRALSKKPGERQADAAVLARELQDALDASSPVDSRPPVELSEPATVRLERHDLHAAPPRAGTARRKWAAAGLLVLLACAATAALVIWYAGSADPGRRAGSDSSEVSKTTEAGPASVTPADEGGPAKDEAKSLSELIESIGKDGVKPEAASGETPVSAAGRDLKGVWAGSYGPLDQPATLNITESGGGRFSGVLEQGAIRVAFVGSLDASTSEVTFQETRVLSGGSWSLGENRGALSADGRTMSGKGRDPVGAQLGMSYRWSFSRR